MPRCLGVSLARQTRIIEGDLASRQDFRLYHRAEATKSVDRTVNRNEGFSVRDGVAIVVGAAVASVHMKSPVDRAFGAGWGLVWLTFAGVGLTAAGPIVLLIRRFSLRPRVALGLGDRLWAMLGFPWIVTAPVRSSSIPIHMGAIGFYGMILTCLLGLSCLFVFAILWKTWVLKPPGASKDQGEPMPWTEKLGMTVAAAWPLQLGFLLIVLDSEASPTPR